MTVLSLDRVVVRRGRLVVACWLGLAGLLGRADTLTAEPLPKEACDALKGEQEGLAAGGIKDDMAKGPEWAGSNLKADRLKAIERFIELEEQLNFRCGFAKVNLALPEEPVAETGAPVATEAAPPAKPKPKARPASKAAASAKVAAEPEPAKAAEPAAVAAPPAKAKPKPKPKVDDAYRPPAPAEPTADPFAKQLAPKG